MKTIQNIFDNLDLWRNLPAYQLERRADIFFSIYLPEILSRKVGMDIEGVIPEFPIRVGSIQPEQDINKSFKVDYLAKARDGKTILFVELKTDRSSRRGKQDWYLQRASQVGMIELLVGLRQICKVTRSRKKYRVLLGLLQDMGLIVMDNVEAFEIVPADYNIQVVYIQPNNPLGQENVITFEEISQLINKHGDELSLRFSKSLLKWSNPRVGGSAGKQAC
ncbi:MAG: hypothetical protein ABIJ65_01555 [Chloroflexota bacterium]